VRARLNLAPVCRNLYEVAAALGFRWEDGRTDFRRAFRARVFDNRRTFLRDAATGELRADFSRDERDDVDEDAPPPFVRVESAARFGAEIPLEYAYAAWGLLSEEAHEGARPRSQVRGFAGVNAEQIRDFALARVRAMQHVEESFVYKNKKVEKEPLDLSKLGEVEADPSEVPLSRSLEDFLLLEHHASFQERLLHLSLPPRERAETAPQARRRRRRRCACASATGSCSTRQLTAKGARSRGGVSCAGASRWSKSWTSAGPPCACCR
jgi:hypothetical protein